MSDGYSGRKWQCPFFAWDEKKTIHCEAGDIRLKDKESYGEYAARYCAGEWKKCTMARALQLRYEQEEAGK